MVKRKLSPYQKLKIEMSIAKKAGWKPKKQKYMKRKQKRLTPIQRIFQ